MEYKRYWKRFTAALMAGIITCSLAGCGEKVVEPLVAAKTIQTEAKKDKNQAKKETMEQTVSGANEFAWNLYEKLDEKNSFYSPYSIQMALSMLDNGAENETKKELEQMLGIRSLDDRNENLHEIMKGLGNQDTILNTANSVWYTMDKMVQFDSKMNERFLGPLAEFYDAEAFRVDFTKKTAVKELNKWISRRTDKMIPKMLDHLDQKTVMCLVNAVYFKGEWENKFKQIGTQKKKFYGKNKVSTVDMMNSGNWDLRYYSGDGLCGIELPYQNSNLCMQVVIAKDPAKDDISTILEGMSAKEREAFFSKLSKAERQNINWIALPKLAMDYSFDDLKDVLVSLGMQDSFDGERADFRKIGKRIYVSDVKHKAKIEIDEEGSRAAAATVIEMVESACAPIEDPIDFVVDHPYVFVIRDLKTGMILFMGQVNNL